MTATATHPVWVHEVRLAWLAVQAGEFRSPTGRRPTPDAPPTGPPVVWTPTSGERVIPVLGSTGSCGATTVAVALATAAGGPARVVEAAAASATGLSAAATAELGADPHGWTHGTRDQVGLDRAPGPHSHPQGVPLPAPAAGPMVTVVDVAQPLEVVLAGNTWLTALVADAPVVVLAGRATVPGLRRVESCLDQLHSQRVVLALLGPRPARWPRAVTYGVGVRTSALLTDGRMVAVPEDRRLAVLGLTPAPLPRALLAAASRLLTLTEGNPHD